MGYKSSLTTLVLVAVILLLACEKEIISIDHENKPIEKYIISDKVYKIDLSGNRYGLQWSWETSVVGGEEPFTYKWEYKTSENSEYISVFSPYKSKLWINQPKGGRNLFIKVTVTDANGLQTEIEKNTVGRNPFISMR